MVTAQSHRQQQWGQESSCHRCPAPARSPPELDAALQALGSTRPAGRGLTSPSGPPEPAVEVTELGQGCQEEPRRARLALGASEVGGLSRGAAGKEVLFNRHCVCWEGKHRVPGAAPASCLQGVWLCLFCWPIFFPFFFGLIVLIKFFVLFCFLGG